jgi:hypothetical protein
MLLMLCIDARPNFDLVLYFQSEVLDQFSSMFA